MMSKGRLMVLAGIFTAIAIISFAYGAGTPEQTSTLINNQIATNTHYKPLPNVTEKVNFPLFVGKQLPTAPPEMPRMEMMLAGDQTIQGTPEKDNSNHALVALSIISAFFGGGIIGYVNYFYPEN